MRPSSFMMLDSEIMNVIFVEKILASMTWATPEGEIAGKETVAPQSRAGPPSVPTDISDTAPGNCPFYHR